MSLQREDDDDEWITQLRLVGQADEEYNERQKLKGGSSATTTLKRKNDYGDRSSQAKGKAKTWSPPKRFNRQIKACHHRVVTHETSAYRLVGCT
ncbi:hypothetical protein, partial [Providencia sp. PROV201]|uniref:hypothetical protein n=1 Tax=Providencia sp. PROV201 TaxID=2949901 RepID=UPI00234ABC5F